MGLHHAQNVHLSDLTGKNGDLTSKNDDLTSKNGDLTSKNGDLTSNVDSTCGYGIEAPRVWIKPTHLLF